MDNSKEAQDLLVALGAIAETAGILRESLITAGFTREEAVNLAGGFLVETIKQSMDLTKGEK